jgi:hypothetical protein
VAQGVGHEFKPQYLKKKIRKRTKNKYVSPFFFYDAGEQIEISRTARQAL